MHILNDFVSIALKTGGASSSIPHRLNNSSWSTSWLHIKKQCAAWVFEWAVERKHLVSCQGEHPEIISIIYHTDMLQRKNEAGNNTHRKIAYKRWNTLSVDINCTLETALFKGEQCKTWPFKGGGSYIVWENRLISLFRTAFFSLACLSTAQAFNTW